MIPNILLPRYFKWIGILLFACGSSYLCAYTHNLDDVNNPGGLFIQITVLIGLLLIAGAREKTEDEMIRHIRLTSLQWSVFILIGLRVVFKSIAFYYKDANWLPAWQINSLLEFYLILFYYQLYVKGMAIKIFKRGAK